MWKFPKQVSLLLMWLWEVGRLSLEIGTVNGTVNVQMEQNAWGQKVLLDALCLECVVHCFSVVLVSSSVRIPFLIKVLLLDSSPSTV